jgi:hypothetical protein
MASYLFDVQQKNSLEQKGLLKRFSIECYGKQPTIEEMRAEKAIKYQELKRSNRPADKKELDRLFFKYTPSKKRFSKRVFVAKREFKTPTKTRVLNTKLEEFKTTRRKRVASFKRKKREVDDGPYAKRVFYFGKRK